MHTARMACPVKINALSFVNQSFQLVKIPSLNVAKKLLVGHSVPSTNTVCYPTYCLRSRKLSSLSTDESKSYTVPIVSSTRDPSWHTIPAHHVECSHRLISTPDLLLEEVGMIPVAVLGRALRLGLLHIFPGFTPTHHVLGFLRLHVLPLVEGLFVVVDVGACPTVHAIAASWVLVVGGPARYDELVAAERTDWVRSVDEGTKVSFSIQRSILTVCALWL